ncbi:DUF6516 family protein [Haloarculaceae archaeon H-GB2-1]|nr:DUF6516 family protein [Haloarculaceae archaeon H-GB1-1]MEA5385861.1 DUF6516 family protein [Haloarculaceae archaeon H-GB11]MEA5407365.1 DUF6516 family protein [Haloarculaceae archaeon H-GB2-1]
MTGEEDVEKVIDVTHDFGDRFVEVTAWQVPESDRYPEGIKYSMQYGNAAGETILRYDNFPDHPDAAHHHKHVADGAVEDVDFEGLRQLFEDFKDEVNAHGDTWK